MKNYEEQMAFVVRFAAMDLAHLRAGDLLNLQEDMLMFLEWPPPRRREVTREALLPIHAGAREELQKIAQAVIASELASAEPPQEAFKRLYETLCKLAEEGKSIDRGIGVLFPDAAVTPPGYRASGLWKSEEVALNTIAIHPQTAETGYGFPLSLIKGRVQFDLKGGSTPLRLLSPTLSNSFFFAFMVAFQKIDQHRIRPCPACAQIFFAAHGNQEFCSARCASRERMRRLRALSSEEKKKVSVKPTKRKSQQRKEV